MKIWENTLSSYWNRKYLVPTGFVVLFAIIGVIILFISHAATPYASIEAESGTPTGVTTTSDTKASNGSYIQFGTAVTPPPPPPGGGGCTNGGVVAPCIGSATTGASGWGTPVFDDEFNETNGLNTTVWNTENGGQKNGITVSTSNEAVSNGDLILTLASSSSGAEISTNSYALPVGGFAEASVYFPGNGTTIYNWPAWWISGPCWPAAGEADVAEGLGTLTSNYHWGTCNTPGNANNSNTIPGTWSNAFHTYGVYRESNQNVIYWDGTLVRTYSTSDNGQPENLILTNGCSGGCTAGAQVKVDYVRAWQ